MKYWYYQSGARASGRSRPPSPAVPVQSVKVIGNWGRLVSKTVCIAYQYFRANDKYEMTTHSVQEPPVILRRIITNAPLSNPYSNANRLMLIYSIFTFLLGAVAARATYFHCFISVRQYWIVPRMDYSDVYYGSPRVYLKI